MNKFKLNESKYMFIGNNIIHNQFMNLKLTNKLNDKIRERVNEMFKIYIRYRELKFNSHINYIYRKIGKKMVS